MKKPVKKFGGGMIKAAVKKAARMPVKKAAPVGTTGSRLPVAPPPGGGIGMKKGGVVKAKKKPVWDAPRPKDLGKPKKLSTKAKSSAKTMAKKAGRPYPNLVDNMRAARKK
jgi:hypothetical protein